MLKNNLNFNKLNFKNIKFTIEEKMSEYDPIDNGSESEFIIRNQFPENDNIFTGENNSKQINPNNSSLKETNDQISLINPESLGKKRIILDNFEQNFVLEEGEVQQDSLNELNEEKNLINTKINEQKSKKKNASRKYEKDLISMKIQCHYITFMIKLINEILDFLKFDKKDRFKDIKYSIKKDVKKENFDKLKGQKLYEIITNKVSSKNSKVSFDESFNLNLYKKLEKNEIIKNFLNENYLKLFRNIYYKNERNLNLKEYGKDVVITLSNEIKMYHDIEINDKDYINSLNKYVKKMYFSPNKFKIEK